MLADTPLTLSPMTEAFARRQSAKDFLSAAMIVGKAARQEKQTRGESRREKHTERERKRERERQREGER